MVTSYDSFISSSTRPRRISLLPSCSPRTPLPAMMSMAQPSWHKPALFSSELVSNLRFGKVPKLSTVPNFVFEFKYHENPGHKLVQEEHLIVRSHGSTTSWQNWSQRRIQPQSTHHLTNSRSSPSPPRSTDILQRSSPIHLNTTIFGTPCYRLCNISSTTTISTRASQKRLVSWIFPSPTVTRSPSSS
jgi:hypothetical protein